MKKLFISLISLCLFFVSFYANAKTTLVVACPAIDTKTKICEELGNTYSSLNPDIEFEYSPWPSTDEGRTVLGTQLATGTAADIIHYNSGALLGAINPAKTLVPLTGDPLYDNIESGYLPAVTVNDEVYGIPGDYAMGSGFFYNKKFQIVIELYLYHLDFFLLFHHIFSKIVYVFLIQKEIVL